MAPRILEVFAIENFEIVIKYENKEIKVFDVKPYFSIGNFEDLKNEALFKTVRVSFDTIEWINGLDLDPDEIYKNSTPYDKINKSIA